MTKFKVGDKVRVVGNTIGSINHLGDVGIIIEKIDEISRVYVRGTYYGGNWSLDDEIELVKETEEDNMKKDNNQFVGTTKVIKDVINTLDSGGAKMSIEPYGEANVRLTIGAEYRQNAEANCFNKRTLQELIHNLQEVCDLLEP